jgi:hypothetical protein
MAAPDRQGDVLMNAPDGNTNAVNSNSGLPVPAPGPAVSGVATVEAAALRTGEPQDRAFNCYHHALMAPKFPEIIADLLEWLDERNHRTVLNPDTRTWLKFDPGKGFYSPVAGTAEQAARVFIAEAAASARAAYDAGLPAWRGSDKYPYLWTWKLLTEQSRHPEDPTVEAIARAMTDTAAGGIIAENTRAQLKAGRSPRILFLPMLLAPDLSGNPYWHMVTDDLGYRLYDGQDPELDPCEYREIPLRAAGYAPDLDAPRTTGFDRLCELVWPDPVVREAALRALSMGFTGRATKYVIYFSSETGRAKSLVAALMSDLLGGYAKSVPAKTLFGYNADPQRAAEELAGAWLVIVEEGIGDQSFKADATFKLMTTGGGDLNARRLYQESRQEAATHTVLLAVNPEAGMNYADPAIMARLCPIQFDGDPAAIAEYADHYNPSTAAWKAEAPAVLEKMLRYARDFWSGAWKPYTLADIMAGGEDLAIDGELAFAVEMKTDSNVGAFIEATRLQLSQEKAGHRARDLFRQYTLWTIRAGQDAVSETAFGRALAKHDGVTRVKGRDANRYFVTPPAIGQ